MGDYLQHPFSPTSSDSKASEGSATEESSWEGQAFAFQSSQHGKVACSPRAFRMIFPFHYSLLLNICKDIRFGWEINDDVCSWIEWSVQHPMVQILTSKITWLTTWRCKCHMQSLTRGPIRRHWWRRRSRRWLDRFRWQGSVVPCVLQPHTQVTLASHLQPYWHHRVVPVHLWTGWVQTTVSICCHVLLVSSSLVN